MIQSAGTGRIQPTRTFAPRRWLAGARPAPTHATALLTMAIAVAILATACTSTGPSGSFGSAVSSRDILTFQEMDSGSYGSVYEAVRALRPRWLQSRGGASIRHAQRQTPRVYLDGQLHGGLDDLWSLAPQEVSELRFLNASDATTRFGTNHIGGAIVISTRR